MFKVYKYDGHYIQGELISKHTTESAAMKSAKKNIFFKNAVKSKIVKPQVIWLDDENNRPVGLITMK
tara:strand:+ start:227 stop:427 length:201 start_codon:yes stop_codon:yes gene_type:complete